MIPAAVPRSVRRPPSPRARRRWELGIAAATILAGAACGPRTADDDGGGRDATPPPEASRPGWWRPVRDAARLTEEQKAAIERLESIAYVAGSREARGAGGVTVHARDRSSPGPNFYTSGHAPEALLIDAEGAVLHRWACAFEAAFPDHPRGDDHAGAHYWRRAHLFENGDVLAIFEGLGLVKVDRHSRPLWARPNRAHHDLEVLPNGDIWVLTRDAHLVPRIHETEPIVEDFVTVLDSNGEEIRRVSLLEAFERSDFDRYWFGRRFQGGDLFHTNTLEVLESGLESRNPAFRAGRVLTSMRHLDAIAVVDLEPPEVVWVKDGRFRRQHDPKIVGTDRLLLFNNDFPSRGSSVMEFDLASMEVVWEYRGSEASPFYTEMCGAAQRLPNGNTLITESDAGRVFEVTPAGEIVWEFFNPHRAGENGELIAAVFEMTRLAPRFPTDWTAGADAVDRGR